MKIYWKQLLIRDFKYKNVYYLIIFYIIIYNNIKN